MKQPMGWLVGALLGWGVAFAAPAMAGDDAFTQLLDNLAESGTLSADAKARIGKAAEKEKAKHVRLGGRIQLDAATYTGDDNDHGAGTELRRARLFATGKPSAGWDYKLQYDFTGSGSSGIQDAFIRYKAANGWSIKTGHFKEPFSLQNMTSSKNVHFIERGTISAFLPGRSIGVAAYGDAGPAHISVGLFADGQGDPADGSDESYGATARATFAPVAEKTKSVHLGGAVSFRDTGRAETVRFRERPESHLTDVYLVDTGSVDADTFTRLVLEAATVQGPLSLQAEYSRVGVSRASAGNPDVAFDGFYIEAGWFFTGESMNYKAGSGSFGAVTPKAAFGKGGPGAWQVVARVSQLNLSDGDIPGGEETNAAVGLNWHPAKGLRYMANVVKVLDVKGGGHDGDTPTIAALRAQVEF